MQDFEVQIWLNIPEQERTLVDDRVKSIDTDSLDEENCLTPDRSPTKASSAQEIFPACHFLQQTINNGPSE